MPKYVIRYESSETYEKEYEAANAEDAEQMFYEDDRIYDGHALWVSGPDIISTEEVNG